MTHLAAAEILLSQDCWPQAQALAVFSYEEAGKACLRLVQMQSPDSLDRFWQLGDAEPAQHVRKLTAAQAIHLLIRVVAGDGASGPAVDAAEELHRLALDYHAKRQRSLYVDLRRGNVNRPSMVGEHEARSTVSAVRTALDYLVPIVTIGIASLADASAQQSVTEFLSRAAAAFEGGDDATAAFNASELAMLEGAADVLKSLSLDVRRAALHEALLAASKASAGTSHQ